LNLKNILITGGSGMIGDRLTDLLLQRGYHVSHLGRTKREGKVTSFVWDIERQYIDPEALRGVDAIVHLAGANVGDKRWTKKRKDVILRSRIDPTRLLYNELKKQNHSVTTVICAAGSSYYGLDNGGKFAEEDDKPGDDFLAVVSQLWERELDKFGDLGLRVVKLRAAIVLSPKGGALKKMKRPTELYVGAVLASGKQPVTWIHIDDHCGIIIKALEDTSMKGAYNSVAPNPVTNEQFTKEMAAALHRPIILPHAPAFILRIVFGEMADVVLYGIRISSEKIIRAGYTFKFPNLREAFEDLLARRMRND
jgi:uncharacterized protein (TIGR01777 family)